MDNNLLMERQVTEELRWGPNRKIGTHLWASLIVVARSMKLNELSDKCTDMPTEAKE